MRVFAVVPAAGQSRRMGRPKLSLPLGSLSVLEHVLAALAVHPFEAILVVIGPETRHLQELVRPPASSMILDSATPDMRTTLQCGIDRLTQLHHPDPEDGIVIALGDQPTIHAPTVGRLLALHAADPQRIRLPTYRSQRGHPVLIPFSILSKLPGIPSNQGLNALVAAFSDQICELPTTEADVLLDMDDPADYRKLADRGWN